MKGCDAFLKEARKSKKMMEKEQVMRATEQQKSSLSSKTEKLNKGRKKNLKKRQEGKVCNCLEAVIFLI